MGDTKVETISRLAQWKIDNFGPCSYKKSDPFKMGLWNWHLAIEKNRYLYVRLFPEPSRVSKDQLPLARFILRVSNLGPNLVGASTLSQDRITSLSSGLLLCYPCRAVKWTRLLAVFCITNSKLFCLPSPSDDFVWPVDTSFYGRLIIDVEFLDLKICPPAGGQAVSIWPTQGNMQSLASQSALLTISRMLYEEIYTDVTITTVDGTLKAHKAMLSASSPVFQSMFLHDLKEKESSTIVIDDMSWESFRALLSYIYGTMNPEDFWKHRLDLLAAANKYDMTNLKDACEESLLEDINSGHVLERLQDAWLYQLDKLKKGCLTYLFDFGKIYDIKDDLNNFFQTADRELLTEMF